MKKIKIVQVISLILFVIYVILIIFNFSVSFIKLQPITIFSIILASVSLSMLFKGVILKSSSTLWFSLNLILYAILIVISNVFNINYIYNNIYLILIPIIPSVITLAVFHNLMYIKVMILNLTIFIPFWVFENLTDNLWWVCSIGIVSIIGGIVICRLLIFNKEKV